jgi:hypothetical protein
VLVAASRLAQRVTRASSTATSSSSRCRVCARSRSDSSSAATCRSGCRSVSTCWVQPEELASAVPGLQQPVGEEDQPPAGAHRERGQVQAQWGRERRRIQLPQLTVGAQPQRGGVPAVDQLDPASGVELGEDRGDEVFVASGPGHGQSRPPGRPRSAADPVRRRRHGSWSRSRWPAGPPRPAAAGRRQLPGPARQRAVGSPRPTRAGLAGHSTVASSHTELERGRVAVW